MYITASFLNDSGLPATGLIPTITIQNINDNSEVLSALMSEVGNGVYKYLFSTYDSSIPYSFVCDARTISNRYAYGSSDIAQSGNGVWDALITSHTTTGTFGDLLQDNFQGVGL